MLNWHENEAARLEDPYVHGPHRKVVDLDGGPAAAAARGSLRQLRQPLTPQPTPHDRGGYAWPGRGLVWWGHPALGPARFLRRHCPFGPRGTVLMVREPFRLRADGTVQYQADAPVPDVPGPWWPASAMPDWASRSALRVGEICVQRVHDIDEAEVRAEGVSDPNTLDGWHAYRRAWTRRHGAESWRSNPWVWVLHVRPVPRRAGSRLAQALGWRLFDEARFQTVAEPDEHAQAFFQSLATQPGAVGYDDHGRMVQVQPDGSHKVIG